MVEVDWQAIFLTLKLACLTTCILLVIGTPLAWWLSRSSIKHQTLRKVVASLVALPLVLPPTVLGFYLLLLMGPNGPLGALTKTLGMDPLPFTFSGLVLASVCYSLPFAVQPLQNTFESLGKRPLEVAATLGASPLDRFFTVVVPLSRTGFLTAAVLVFAHTVGEFGVVLMIGGNIPGETKVLSVAIYDHVETLEYQQAHILAAAMVAFSFMVLMLLYCSNNQYKYKEQK